MSDFDEFKQAFEDQPPTAPARGVQQQSRKPVRMAKPRRAVRKRRRWPWVVLAMLVIAAIGAAVVWTVYEDKIREVLGWTESNDFDGTGEGEVLITITQGEFGLDIARNLKNEGVIKTVDSFYNLLLTTEPEPVFIPGTYQLAENMSAQAALEALLDQGNRVEHRVVIPEGTRSSRIFTLLAEGTGIDASELEKAAEDYTSFGVPEQAPSIEGYLFPATYNFEPGLTAEQILQRLVNRSFQALNSAGVEEKDRHRVLTIASMIQLEARHREDFFKVSRVIQNRLDKNMLLQFDSTVSYGAGSTHRVQTTPAQRADASNKYNTYANPGLPIGPIGSPGDIAIEAALNPAEGKWLYFVAWNLRTGETAFAETAAGHNRNVEKWRAWCRESPENRALCY